MPISFSVHQPAKTILIALLAMLLVSPATPHAAAQQDNPVFVDDSTSAKETLAALPGLLAVGNLGEATRSLQRLLDEEPDRLLASADDPDLFTSVRRRVHDAVLTQPELLAFYREANEVQASSLLAAGDHRTVEHRYWLTSAGHEASLRLAQERLERAEFWAAWRIITSLLDHPDHARRADETLNLARSIASYLDDDEVARTLRAWATDAGVRAVGVAPVGGPNIAEPRTVHNAGREEDLRGLVGTPLRSATLTPEVEAFDDGAIRSIRLRNNIAPPAWTMPAALGDTLFTNDGTTVTAWDRFTLRPRWRREAQHEAIDDPTPWNRRPRRRGVGRIEDTSTVTVVRDMVLATTGSARGLAAEYPDLLTAFDATTGETRWTASLVRLDESLSQAEFRGEPVVIGDTVVLTARRLVRARRLLTVSLVGIDLHTGELEWARPIASAGSLPVQQSPRVADSPSGYRSVIYMADEIGAIAAVEADTGRPIWIRRTSPDDLYRRFSDSTWTSTRPIVWQDRLFLISPNGEFIAQLDRHSGEVLTLRGVSEFAEAEYLMRADNQLVAVGRRNVALIPFADFEDGAPRFTRNIDDPGIAGRVVRIDDRLLLPTIDGALLVEIVNPSASARISLDASGNLLSLPGQLVAVGEARVHSYLAWDVAQDLLRARIADDRTDPSPATTLAELAYRAGRHDMVLAALDDAIAAWSEAQREPAGDRIFSVVSSMISASEATWESTDPPPGDAEPITDPDVLRGLALRLARVARTPEQRVTHLMSLGSIQAAFNDPPAALEAYHRILADESLTAATWRSGRFALRAELEATRRIRGIVAAYGVALYEPWEIEADALARTTTGRSELLELARRYPLSRSAPGWLLEAGRDLANSARPHVAGRTLAAAIDTIELRADAGGELDSPTYADAAGELLVLYARLGRENDVSDLLARVANRGVTPAFPGTDADAATVLADLIASTESATRFPAIGPTLADHDPTLLNGRVLRDIAPPRRSERATNVALLVSVSDQELRLVESSNGEIGERWTREIDREPVLLSLDAARAVVFWPDDASPRVESIDLSTGETVWDTGSIPELLPPLGDDEQRPRETLVPNMGVLPGTQLVFALDEQTIVLAQRRGRSLGLDRATGRVLWSRALAMTSLHDLDINGGLVAAVGIGPTPTVAAGSLAEVLDARSGETIHRVDDAAGTVLWTRITTRGDLILGMDTGLIAINPFEARQSWAVSDRAASETLDGWMLGDTLFLLGSDRTLRALHTRTDTRVLYELADAGKLTPRSRIAASLIDGRAVFATSSGLLSYELDGTLVGTDAIGAVDDLIPAALAGDLAVTIEIDARPASDGRASHPLHILETASGRVTSSNAVVLASQPTIIDAIDGFVLVTAGEATIALPTEAAP